MKSVRKSLCGISIFVLALLAYGCGKDEQAPPAFQAGLESPIFEEGDAPDDADTVPQRPGKPPKGIGTPAWGSSSERRIWANAVLNVVRARLGDLERARDKEVFCPGYASASAAQRANCWLFLVAAVTKFESAFKPDTSFREPDGNYSVGLLALSPGECPNAPSLQSLKAAIPNLVCGTNKLASLIARDGYIDGPHPSRGAARYWSTLRAPYKRWDPTRNRHLNLGKRNLILPLVRGYRGHSLRSHLTSSSVEMDEFEFYEE